MKAIILAGGALVGSFPISPELPRALLPVANSPLLAHTLGLLARSGFEEAVVCASGDTAGLAEELGWQTGDMKITYRTSHMPCGPGGCLRLARDRVQDEPFLAIEGSVLVDFDPAAFLNEHSRADAVVAVATRDTSDPSSNGSASLIPPAGVYVFGPAVFDHISPSGYLDIKQQLLPALAEAGMTLACAELPGAHCSVRDLGSLLGANFQMLKGRFPGLFNPADHRAFAQDVWATGPVFTGPNVRLIGPILFGSSIAIASGATVIGPAAIGSNCYIGKDAVVRESVLWRHNIVEDRAKMYRCIMSASATMPERLQANGALIIDTPLKLGEVHMLRQGRHNVSDLPPRSLAAPVQSQTPPDE